MSEPRNHHYVPQVYLKAFADRRRGGVVVYDRHRPADEHLLNPQIEHVRDVAFERDFYSMTRKDVIDVSLERGFGVVENRYRKIIKALKGGDLSAGDRKVLGVLAASQEARSPRGRHMLTQPVRQLQELVRAEYRARIPDITDGEVEARIEELARNTFMDSDADLTPENISLGGVPVSFEVRCAFFTRMFMCILTSTAHNFVTSDHPVCWLDPPYHAATGRGLKHFVSITAEVTYPLTKRHCLFMSYMPLVETAEASAEVVTEINGRTGANSLRFCFASPTSSLGDRVREMTDVSDVESVGKPLVELFVDPEAESATPLIEIANALDLSREDLIVMNQPLLRMHAEMNEGSKPQEE